ncbi:MAG: O-antigen ligase family protein, partial [bacterium]|nr:O-antigen ligase family protein [bacterium]
WDPHPGRLFSTWLDPNLLGGFFVLAIAVLVGAPRTARPVRKFFLLVAGALLVLAVVLTKSRTSLLALAAVGGTSLLILRSWRRWFPLATAAALGLLLVPSFAVRLRGFSAADPTASLRLQSWGQALQQFSKFPLFGTGYNAYGFEQLAAGNIGNLALHSRAGADNSFLTLGATTGVWGSVILFLLLNALLWILLRRWRRDPPTRALLPVVLSAFVAFLVHAQFVHSLVYVHLLVPFILLLSGALRSDNSRQESLPT